jgi:hypothetical protein
MNKKGISDVDLLEIIKITILTIIGYIIIKSLLSEAPNNKEVECFCNCLNDTIYNLKPIYLR